MMVSFGELMTESSPDPIQTAHIPQKLAIIDDLSWLSISYFDIIF